MPSFFLAPRKMDCFLWTAPFWADRQHNQSRQRSETPPLGKEPAQCSLTCRSAPLGAGMWAACSGVHFSGLRSPATSHSRSQMRQGDWQRGQKSRWQGCWSQPLLLCTHADFRGAQVWAVTVTVFVVRNDHGVSTVHSGNQWGWKMPGLSKLGPCEGWHWDDIRISESPGHALVREERGAGTGSHSCGNSRARMLGVPLERGDVGTVLVREVRVLALDSEREREPRDCVGVA